MIVAIKQLQAQNQSLSDIQQKLVGLPSNKLQAIANLPSEFWKASDRYLKSQKPTAQLPSGLSNAESHDAGSNDFWVAPAALPSIPASTKNRGLLIATHETLSVIRIEAPNGIKIVIELPCENQAQKNLDIQSLLQASNVLIEELIRQQLAKTN